MTVTTWSDPAREVVDRLGVGMDALWAVVFAAQAGALQLSLVSPLVCERPLSAVAMDLGEAIAELEWVRPELAAHGLGIDLAPLPADDLDAGRQALAGLVRVAVDVAVEMVHDTAERLGTSELLAVSRAVTLLGTAYLGTTGRLP